MTLKSIKAIELSLDSLGFKDRDAATIFRYKSNSIRGSIDSNGQKPLNFEITQNKFWP